MLVPPPVTGLRKCRPHPQEIERPTSDSQTPVPCPSPTYPQTRKLQTNRKNVSLVWVLDRALLSQGGHLGGREAQPFPIDFVIVLSQCRCRSPNGTRALRQFDRHTV